MKIKKFLLLSGLMILIFPIAFFHTFNMAILECIEKVIDPQIAKIHELQNELFPKKKRKI